MQRRTRMVATAFSLALGACSMAGADLDPEELGDAEPATRGLDGRAGGSEEPSDEPLLSLSGAAEPGCEAHKATLFVDGRVAAGRVTVESTVDQLRLVVSGNERWQLESVEIYAGTALPPTAGAGEADWRRFPYGAEFGEPVARHALLLPLDVLDTACGGALHIAVHTRSVNVEHGQIVGRGEGWALGEEALGAGWSFGYPICCGERHEVCTWTQGHWKTHHAAASPAALREPWPIREATLLCGSSWLEIMQTAPVGGDGWTILAHQWITMKLNQAAGTRTARELEAIRARAKQLLEACEVTDEQRDEALSIAETLEAYNQGVIGPGHCGA